MKKSSLHAILALLQGQDMEVRIYLPNADETTEIFGSLVDVTVKHAVFKAVGAAETSTIPLGYITKVSFKTGNKEKT